MRTTKVTIAGPRHVKGLRGGQRCVQTNQGPILCALRGKQELTKEKKLFQISRQGENEVLIASEARWDEQVLNMIELERRCLTFREGVEYFCEKQEVLADLRVSKRDRQKEAPEKHQEKIFEEFKKLEERRAKEALELAQKMFLSSGKAKRRGQGCCKDWKDRGRQSIGMTLKTIYLLSRALPWHVIWKKRVRSLRGR